MILDLGIILTYFVVIMIIGIWSRAKSDVGVEEYFLSSRSLKWPYSYEHTSQSLHRNGRLCICIRACSGES